MKKHLSLEMEAKAFLKDYLACLSGPKRSPENQGGRPKDHGRRGTPHQRTPGGTRFRKEGTGPGKGKKDPGGRNPSQTGALLTERE